MYICLLMINYDLRTLKAWCASFAAYRANTLRSILCNDEKFRHSSLEKIDTIPFKNLQILFFEVYMQFHRCSHKKIKVDKPYPIVNTKNALLKCCMLNRGFFCADLLTLMQRWAFFMYCRSHNSRSPVSLNWITLIEYWNWLIKT